MLGARRMDRTQALAAEIAAEGGLATPVTLDVTDEASVIAAFDTAEAECGLIDGIVCNAGIGTGGHATNVPLAGLEGIIGTNLLGAYLVAREGARRLIASGSREHERGRIVLIGSITAERAGMGDSMYAATKAGLAHLGRNLAREWIRQGINVNTVQPGIIPTEINSAYYATAPGQERIGTLHRRRLLRTGALDDMVLYLLSDASAQVTGSTFTIDDGQSL